LNPDLLYGAASQVQAMTMYNALYLLRLFITVTVKVLKPGGYDFVLMRAEVGPAFHTV